LCASSASVDVGAASIASGRSVMATSPALGPNWAQVQCFDFPSTPNDRRERSEKHIERAECAPICANG
jgi:hypothetical protein